MRDTNDNLGTQFLGNKKDGDYEDNEYTLSDDESSDDDDDLERSNEVKMKSLIDRALNELGPAPEGYVICIYAGASGQPFDDRLRQLTGVNYSQLFGVMGRPLGIIGNVRAGRLLLRGLDDGNCKQSILANIEAEWVRGALWLAGQDREIVSYNFAQGGGGGYAGLDVTCEANGFSLYVACWHEYTGGMSAEEYKSKRRTCWNLNAKATFSPKEEFLLRYLGIANGMTGTVQLNCPEGLLSRIIVTT